MNSLQTRPCALVHARRILSPRNIPTCLCFEHRPTQKPRDAPCPALDSVWILPCFPAWFLELASGVEISNALHCVAFVPCVTQEYEEAWRKLRSANGILVPGGFGNRGVEGKILAINYARTNRVPFLGICLGMQLAVIEFCRNVLDMKDANSTEFDQGTPTPVRMLPPPQVVVHLQSRVAFAKEVQAACCEALPASAPGSHAQ